MADESLSLPDNTPGPYYVDKSCTGCSLCLKFAPANIKLTSSFEFAFIESQPQSKEECLQMSEAISNCPVMAIGKR